MYFRFIFKTWIDGSSISLLLFLKKEIENKSESMNGKFWYINFKSIKILTSRITFVRNCNFPLLVLKIVIDQIKALGVSLDMLINAEMRVNLANKPQLQRNTLGLHCYPLSNSLKYFTL